MLVCAPPQVTIEHERYKSHVMVRTMANQHMHTLTCTGLHNYILQQYPAIFKLVRGNKAINAQPFL